MTPFGKVQYFDLPWELARHRRGLRSGHGGEAGGIVRRHNDTFAETRQGNRSAVPGGVLAKALSLIVNQGEGIVRRAVHQGKSLIGKQHHKAGRGAGCPDRNYTWGQQIQLPVHHIQDRRRRSPIWKQGIGNENMHLDRSRVCLRARAVVAVVISARNQSSTGRDNSKKASAAFNPEAPNKMRNEELDARNGIIAEPRQWNGRSTRTRTAGYWVS